MCTHSLTQRRSDDRLLGMEECKSPFGTYDIKIPVDSTLSCTGNSWILGKNCKDLEVIYNCL